jgi:cytochrome c peroxidase
MESTSTAAPEVDEASEPLALVPLSAADSARLAAPLSQVEAANISSASLSGDGLAPLSRVPVPQPVGGDIVNQAAAIRLGKAFFWDVQLGSDGQVACATCHFRAGADNRRQNTLNPGPDLIFASGGVTAAGQLFNGASIVNDDRVGSQGVARSTFVSIASDPATAADVCTPVVDPQFASQRRVTGRNTPSPIGAVFFRDNFWDGRANHVFNGVDPFGTTGNASGSLVTVQNASLASQADGPPTNDVEMSCTNRAFNGPNSLGAKLLVRTPLQFQLVSTTDSVLGTLSNAPGNGLRCGSAPCTYGQMITDAYGATLGGNALQQFSRIWGQAVQAYEATLIPDQTPYDRFLAGNSNALTTQQQRGLDRFKGKGNCTKCHAGAELSDATVSFVASQGLINEDGGDQGFHNIGVRPTNEDLGRAATGPNLVSFSVSGSTSDRGAFKTAGLRNVKLTAPYFHNGGKAALADVVAFYNRGGDFANPELADRIQPLSLDSVDQAALVEFLTNGLTDCRVEKERAPFDHPALVVPNGASLPAVGASGTGSCP